MVTLHMNGDVIPLLFYDVELNRHQHASDGQPVSTTGAGGVNLVVKALAREANNYFSNSILPSDSTNEIFLNGRIEVEEMGTRVKEIVFQDGILVSLRESYSELQDPFAIGQGGVAIVSATIAVPSLEIDGVRILDNRFFHD